MPSLTITPKQSAAIICCRECDGSGRFMRHDPQFDDPYLQTDRGECEACDGSGNQTCDIRGCRDGAVAMNEDREALCSAHHSEWLREQAEDQFQIAAE